MKKEKNEFKKLKTKLFLEKSVRSRRRSGWVW